QNKAIRGRGARWAKGNQAIAGRDGNRKQVSRRRAMAAASTFGWRSRARVDGEHSFRAPAARSYARSDSSRCLTRNGFQGNQGRSRSGCRFYLQETRLVIELNLTKPGAGVLVGLLTLAACALLALLIVSRFVIGTLADRRLQVTRAMLKIPVEYLPGSARLNARLAAAEFSEGDRDLASAKLYAERAVNLSPFDHRIWLTLASIEEATGDRRAAESALRAA